MPISLLRGAGAAGVSLDLGVLAASGYDDLATVLDEGGQVFLGVAPSTGTSAPSAKSVIERVQRLLDMIGLDAGEVSDQLVLTPACGLAGATASYAAQRAGLAPGSSRGARLTRVLHVIGYERRVPEHEE